MHHAKDRDFTSFVAVGAVAAELAIIFIGATLPTPLYPLYRTAFSFSGLVLTLIYAVYVFGNLVALLILGRLSDQIGRKSITLPAIAFGIASTILFAFASSVTWLFAARILSGIATGLAAGAATAWIAELSAGKNKLPTAKIASAANFAGLAVAPLASGLRSSPPGRSAYPMSYTSFSWSGLLESLPLCPKPWQIQNSVCATSR
ncbi:MFS transporter [Rhizobium sp. BR 362]|uniref:MFS transporter n=1 Tax=Rhizobium sp. BR 362 TaxID=3040670 RepID=UPI002F3E260A